MRLGSCFASCLWLMLLAGPALAADKPNIVLIMADDLGFETLGCNGGTSYKTPALDRLAAEGTRFTRCFVQPLCTPTRVQLMTGQYNIRNYVRFGLLPTGETTFANLLQKAGYATCIVGKWQLGQAADLPQKFGFAEACLWQHTRRPPRYANPGLEINGVAKDFSHGEYGPDLVNEYALDFVARHKGEPFLLYYPLMLTHSPYQATPDSPDWNSKQQGEQAGQHERHFGEMVTYMDKLLGKLFARIDELGLADNTLIVFLGDNGTGKGVRSQLGAETVIGGKGSTTAAGMHVPLIVRSPKRAGQPPPAGRVCHDLVDSTDLLPTLLAAAGVAPPPQLTLDGRSFLPQTYGEVGQPREWVYSWYSPRQGSDLSAREFAFDKRYKLYRDGAFYAWADDRSEKKPLTAGDLPAEAQAARAKLAAALAQYRNARPAALDRQEPAAPPAGKAKKNRGGKGKTQPEQSNP